MAPPGSRGASGPSRSSHEREAQARPTSSPTGTTEETPKPDSVTGSSTMAVGDGDWAAGSRAREQDHGQTRTDPRARARSVHGRTVQRRASRCSSAQNRPRNSSQMMIAHRRHEAGAQQPPRDGPVGGVHARHQQVDSVAGHAPLDRRTGTGRARRAASHHPG